MAYYGSIMSHNIFSICRRYTGSIEIVKVIDSELDNRWVHFVTDASIDVHDQNDDRLEMTKREIVAFKVHSSIDTVNKNKGLYLLLTFVTQFS